MGTNGQNSTFQNTVMLHINLKRIKMQQHGSKLFVRRPLILPPTLGMGSVGQNSTFSEHGHVAYNTKRIKNAATWKQIFCPQTSPLRPWGWGQSVKIQLFQSMVMLYIKLKRITNAATWLSADPPPPPTPPINVHGQGNMHTLVSIFNRSKFNFSRIWSCCLSNKRESRMQQY